MNSCWEGWMTCWTRVHRVCEIGLLVCIIFYLKVFESEFISMHIRILLTTRSCEPKPRRPIQLCIIASAIKRTSPGHKYQFRICRHIKWNYFYLLWMIHDDVIKWKHFPRYWPFVRGIPRSPANSPRKGQRRGPLMLSLICAWINGWVNNREAGDWRGHHAHHKVIVMCRPICRPRWLYDMEALSTSFSFGWYPPVTSQFPHKGSVIGSFGDFIVVIPNKLMNEQSICRWFETHLRSCDVTVVIHISGHYHA